MFQHIHQAFISAICFAGLLFVSFSAQAGLDPTFCDSFPTHPDCVATVPEPSILWLFGLGFVGLAIIRRINKKK